MWHNAFGGGVTNSSLNQDISAGIIDHRVKDSLCGGILKRGFCHSEVRSTEESVNNEVKLQDIPTDSSLTLRMTDKKKAAFTLAESLIVVIVLGVIAVIVIPPLIEREYLSESRSKIRKAMADYEKVVSNARDRKQCNRKE